MPGDGDGLSTSGTNVAPGRPRAPTLTAHHRYASRGDAVTYRNVYWHRRVTSSKID